MATNKIDKFKAQVDARIAADAKTKKGPSVTSTVAQDTAGNPPAATSGKKALSGVPVGTPIMTGQTASRPPQFAGAQPIASAPVYAKAIYTAESPYQISATMSNQEKANLLLRLSLIPGLYAKGQAPTQDYIKNLASNNALSLRPEDYSAFTKILTIADNTGQDYNTTLGSFISNPKLAQQYFGQVTTAAKQVVTTSPDILKADLNSRFLDMFDSEADPKTADAYVKDVTNLEKKAAAAGQNVSSQQRQDILLKYVAQTANARYAKVKGTTDTTDDVAIEKGALGSTLRSLRNAYADNGIPIKEADVYKLAISATRSQQALQNALDDINMQASIQFPALKDWFARGKTAKQFFAPYTTAYSKIYGVPEDQVDVSKFYDVASGTSVVPVNTWISNQWKNPLIKETQYYKDINRGDLRSVADAFGITV